jgi:hypothetical protein
MDWFRRVMMGRYGNDQLSIALLVFYVVLSIAAQVTHLYVIMLIAYIPLVLCFYRMLSRNTGRRYQENVRFLKYWNPVQLRLYNFGKRMKDRKTHRYFKCPNCSSMLRVPRGKGKISITCPMCKKEFVKKT